MVEKAFFKPRKSNFKVFNNLYRMVIFIRTEEFTKYYYLPAVSA